MRFEYVCPCQGGYDLLGRTKDQIRTTEQVNAALAACNALKLDGLVIIGGEIYAQVFHLMIQKIITMIIIKYENLVLLKGLLQTLMQLS